MIGLLIVPDSNFDLAEQKIMGASCSLSRPQVAAVHFVGERRRTADRRSFLACLQETTEAASGRPADEAEANVKSSGSSDGSLSHTAPSAGGDSAAEMARFGAAKERKHSREAGIALFNRQDHKPGTAGGMHITCTSLFCRLNT